MGQMTASQMKSWCGGTQNGRQCLTGNTRGHYPPCRQVLAVPYCMFWLCPTAWLHPLQAHHRRSTRYVSVSDSAHDSCCFRMTGTVHVRCHRYSLVHSRASAHHSLPYAASVAGTAILLCLLTRACCLQVYASYNYRRDLTNVVRTPGMLSRARSLSRDEAETQEADVGKGDAGVSVHPPTMRQAVAWELAMRVIRQSEVGDIFIHLRQHSCTMRQAQMPFSERELQVCKAHESTFSCPNLLLQNPQRARSVLGE